MNKLVENTRKWVAVDQNTCELFLVPDDVTLDENGAPQLDSVQSNPVCGNQLVTQMFQPITMKPMIEYINNHFDNSKVIFNELREMFDKIYLNKHEAPSLNWIIWNHVKMKNPGEVLPDSVTTKDLDLLVACEILKIMPDGMLEVCVDEYPKPTGA